MIKCDLIIQDISSAGKLTDPIAANCLQSRALAVFKMFKQYVKRLSNAFL